METVIVCTQCRRRLMLPEELSYKQVMCPGCSFVFVPKGDGAKEPLAAKLTRLQPIDAKHRSALQRREPRSPDAWTGPVPPVRRSEAGESDLPLAELFEGSAALLEAPPRLSPAGSPRPPVRRLRRKLQPMSQNPLLPLAIVGGCVGLVVVVVVIFLVARGFTRLGWEELSSPEGRFKVLMPPGVQNKRKDSPTPMGNVTMIEYRVETSGEGYAVRFADLPAAFLAMPAEAVLEGMSKNAAIGGSIHAGAPPNTESRSISLDGCPGREVVMDFQGQAQAVMRVYLVRGRMYQLLVVGRRVSPSSADVQRFFESFKLTG